jgi:Tfp pilus assembly protein PilZ
MTEKRKEERYKRRLQLRFSTENGSTIGFTDDISSEGIFVRSASVQPVGTAIRIELTTQDNEKVVLGGTVQWKIKLSPTLLRQGKKAGMGIKISNFVSGEESYRKILESCEKEAENKVSAL